MKTLGIALYHSNARQYPASWVRECLTSLLNQKPVEGWEFIFYELNYGKDGRQMYEPSIYRHYELENYAAAMNFIYDWIFQSCDAVANVNIDDWYAENRLAVQLPLLDEYDIVSSNYIVTDEFGHPVRSTDFANLDVPMSLLAFCNIVSNPAHVMKKAVFEKLKFDPSKVPAEDLLYWQQCVQAGFKIKIVQDFLHYRREHPMQEGNKKH